MEAGFDFAKAIKNMSPVQKIGYGLVLAARERENAASGNGNPSAFAPGQSEGADTSAVRGGSAFAPGASAGANTSTVNGSTDPDYSHLTAKQKIALGLSRQ